MDTKNDDLQEDQITQTDDNDEDVATDVTTDTQDADAVVSSDDDDTAPSVEETSEEETDDEKKEMAKEETEEEEVMYATPNALNNPASQGVAPNPVANLMNLESLINRHVGDIEKVKEKMKTEKDMFNDSFQNDAVYAELDQKVKEMNRQKNAAKQKLLKQPSLVATSERILALKDDLKDLQEGLSGYLRQYQELSKTNQIIGENGEVREIITSHKLIKKGGKYKP